MFSLPWRPRRRSDLLAEPAKPTAELTPEIEAGLAEWLDRVCGTDEGAKRVMEELAAHCAGNWPRLLRILMDLDREGIRGADVAERFDQCERSVELFEASIR